MNITDKSLILNRIKSHYKFASSAEMATFLGIMPNTLSSWYKRNTLDWDLIFAKCSDISIDLLLNDNENIPIGRLLERHSTDDIQGIPLIPVEAVAGIGVENDYSITLDQIEDRYEVPLFKNKGVDFLTYVRGNSMYPKYNAGDVVACSFLKERLYIQWGRVYVLDTKSQGPLIKRVVKGTSEDHLICRSENEKYGDFNVPFYDIRSLSLVVGVIRFE